MAKTRIADGMTLVENQVEQIHGRLFTRFRRSHDRIDERNGHFFNRSEFDPQIGNPLNPEDPFKNVTRYQSTALRDIDAKLASRLGENPPQVRCKAGQDTASADSAANDAEVTLNAWLQDIEESMGKTLIEALSPGPSRLGYIGLHWYRDDYVLPMPEYDWLDQLPQDKSQAKNYQDMRQWCPDCMGAGTVDSGGEDSGTSLTSGAPANVAGTRPSAEDSTPPPMKPCPTCDGAGMTLPDGAKVTYRETPQALQNRYQREKARAGSPFCLEVIDPLNIAFERGIGRQKGLAWVAVKKELSRLDYDEANGEDQEADPTGRPQDYALTPDITISTGTSGITTNSPSGSDYTERVTLYQLWRALPRTTGYKSRNGGGFEFYEAVSGYGASGFELRKAFRLPSGIKRLPFAICGGIRKGSSDPEFEWEPYLEGMFRQKPFLDRFKTLYLSIIEQQAHPSYREQMDPKIPSLLPDGRDANSLPNSAAAGRQAPGSTITQLEFRTDPAISQAFQTLIEEWLQSLPDTGQAELSATTAPWTARIGIQQANAGPAMLLRNIARCLEEAFQDIAYQCSLEDAKQGGLGEPTTTYARGEDGRVNPGKTVTVEPSVWANLHVAVEINPVSESERVAKAQHGMELLNAGLITREDFYRNYLIVEDADDYAMKVMVETSLMPYELQFIQQIAAAQAGTRFLMGLNGEVVGQGGAPADPRQVLGANGYRPVAQQQAAGPGNQAAMPGLPSLNAPNTQPLAGVPG